ncbi:hypothetical protein E4U30_005733 [Claviceps sp. LM220 group G6]|nr:hypothetical protein E4U30_005733 [Claviceps sp. LM220 group G6]
MTGLINEAMIALEKRRRLGPNSESTAACPYNRRSGTSSRPELPLSRVQWQLSNDHSNGGDGDGEDDGDGDNGAEEDDAAVTKAWKNQLVQEAEEELVSQDALGPLPNTLDPPIWMPIVRLSRVSSDLHK